MKKDAILRAATRLFAERGFGNTPTILLAREAGVAEGTIFRHFKSKDEIFRTLIEQVRNQLRADIAAYVQSRNPTSGMETALAIARAFCVFVRKNRMEFGLVFRDASSRYGDDSDPAFRAIRTMYEDVGYLFYEAILQGQADGTVGAAIHPQDTAAMLVCMLMGFMRGVHFNVIRQTEVKNDMIPHMLTNIALMLSPEASAGPQAAGLP
ncbi:MAG: TetR/AcrR family transcriptional regulator [Desulfovibrionaceae bacterium]|nr:TetR/AcrR family transcriptional regulator [Desulfovibrionaceae bacterium]